MPRRNQRDAPRIEAEYQATTMRERLSLRRRVRVRMSCSGAGIEQIMSPGTRMGGVDFAGKLAPIDTSQSLSAGRSGSALHPRRLRPRATIRFPGKAHAAQLRVTGTRLRPAPSESDVTSRLNGVFATPNQILVSPVRGRRFRAIETVGAFPRRY